MSKSFTPDGLFMHEIEGLDSDGIEESPLVITVSCLRCGEVVTRRVWRKEDGPPTRREVSAAAGRDADAATLHEALHH